MPSMYRRRRTRFGTTRRAAVTQSSTSVKKRRRCAACKTWIEVGDAATRLRLSKRFRQPCAGCGHKLVGSKLYHNACVPGDISAAMGYNPTQHIHAAAPAAAPVAPPPKPRTASDASLAALAALQEALILKLRDTPSAWMMRNGKRVLTPEWEKPFARIQNIKARVLRPGTPAEGEVATHIALQQLVKLVYTGKEN